VPAEEIKNGKVLIFSTTAVIIERFTQSAVTIAKIDKK
jgi:hypothetical protein